LIDTISYNLKNNSNQFNTVKNEITPQKSDLTATPLNIIFHPFNMGEK